jgi:hypothetical protein
MPLHTLACCDSYVLIVLIAALGRVVLLVLMGVQLTERRKSPEGAKY